MSSETTIKVENLSKDYLIYERPQDRLKQSILPKIQRFFGFKAKEYSTKFSALNNISFEVRRGETVGIIGKNGSGKSTLLQIICGTLLPTNGTVETSGRIAALLELGSGFNPEFSGEENVFMYASILGLSTEQITARYDDIIAFADIGDFIKQPIKTYSSGMIVRLAFAVIVHVDADILIIDEALSVGDAFFVQKCMRFLRKFMETGTVLFVSHDTGSILNLCEKAILLNKGELIGIGEPKEITERYLENIYNSLQGESKLQEKKAKPTEPQVNNDDDAIDDPAELKDMRQDFVNQSNLRNDIQLFKFNDDSASFGKGGVTINKALLTDEKDKCLSWVVGGEKVRLSIHSIPHQNLSNPIVGFQVKDRLGQVIFADNTYLTHEDNPLFVSANEELIASFDFIFPILPNGDYVIATAIADGSFNNHVQHQWIHEALKFKVHSSSICYGLVGVPMKKIALKIGAS